MAEFINKTIVTAHKAVLNSFFLSHHLQILQQQSPNLIHIQLIQVKNWIECKIVFLTKVIKI